MRSLCLTLCIGLLCGTIRGQSDPPGVGVDAEPSIVNGPSDEFRYRLGVRHPIPNVELPPHIQAKEGELTFIADFANRGKDGLPLYLINRTGKAVSFASEDHDIYVRLEYLDEKGNWVRAQTHRNSWCGNSYYPVKLEPGQHFRFTGYRPAVGDGFYLEADRRASALDDMAANDIPQPMGWMLRAEPNFPYRFPKSDKGYVFVLDLLSRFSESDYYRNEATKKMAMLGKDSPLTPRIRKILDRDWPVPDRADCDSLVKESLDHIEGNRHPDICWKIIAFLLEARPGTRYAISPEWKPRIAATLSLSLERDNEWEHRIAAEVIANSGFSNEFVSDDSLLKWLHSEQSAVVTASANGLATRGKIAELVQTGSELPGDQPFLILAALASGGKSEGSRAPIRHPGTEEERNFWDRCLRQDTIKAVRYLPRTMESFNSYNRIVHAPVKDYLGQVAARMGSDPEENKDLYELSSLVRFFGTWRMPENIPVLQSLLKHPQYIESEVSSSRDGRYLQRDYRIRRDARKALMAMGVPVDPDLVVEGRIPLPATEN